MRSLARLALTLAIVGAATLVLAPWHWLAVRTGALSRTFAPPLWNRIVLRALGWRVRVEGAPAAERPLLIAANHVSWSDIMVVLSHADAVFVAKSDVRSWPLIGFLARLQDTVFIDRDNRRDTGRQVGEMAERLLRNETLVLFAEGTTGDGNVPLPFKSSLFGAVEAAAREGGTAFVQPAAIAYTRLHGVPMGRNERDIAAWAGSRTLPAHLALLSRHGPLDVTIRFGEPLAFPAGVGRKLIASQAEAAVRGLAAQALRDG